MNGHQTGSTGGGHRSAWSNLIAAIGIAASAVGLLYYVASLYGMAIGDGHRATPEMKRPFQPLDSSAILLEPWSKGHWESVDTTHLKLRVDSAGDQPVVVVEGLEYGEIFLCIKEISDDGNSYRGHVFCAEHGGCIAKDAYLDRAANNRLRLRVDFASDQTSNIDMLFRHVILPRR